MSVGRSDTGARGARNKSTGRSAWRHLSHNNIIEQHQQAVVGLCTSFRYDNHTRYDFISGKFKRKISKYTYITIYIDYGLRNQKF